MLAVNISNITYAGVFCPYFLLLLLVLLFYFYAYIHSWKQQTEGGKDLM